MWIWAWVMGVSVGMDVDVGVGVGMGWLVGSCLAYCTRSPDHPSRLLAVAKYWCTDLQQKICDHGVQIHGGWGYMWEYPVCRAYVDSRVQSIYGGSNEIMKELISRSITS